FRIAFRKPATARVKRILKTDAKMTAKQDGLHRHRHLVPARAQNGPAVFLAEQPVRRPAHMQHIFGMRPDPAKDAEDRLHEERRFHVTAPYEMLQRVKMTDVVAFDLETRVIIGAGRKDSLDIGEGVAENPVAGALDIGFLPIVFELWHLVED